MMPERDEILASQGWVVVEIDRGQRFRAGEDGLLHFRVRNLQDVPGRLNMRLEISGVSLHRDEQSIRLMPGQVHDLRFSLFAKRPGQKLVEALDLRFELDGQSHRLTLPDHAIVLQIAAPGQRYDGDIRLENVTFDFRDHVGDVSIKDLIALQDAKSPEVEGEDWQALRLISRPLHGHVVIQQPRSKNLRDLVLVGPESEHGREQKIFLFGRGELCFGLKSRKGNEPIPLVLRRLPCRSREADPDNWHRNTLISQLHGKFALHDDLVCVRDQSSNGTRLGRERLTKEEWVDLPRSFKLRVPATGDVLTLTGELHYPKDPGRELVLGLPVRGDMGAGFEVGAEHPHVVDSLSLRREGNLEEHTYVQVFRVATVGSHEGCAVRIDADDVAVRHAEIVLYEGEWFIHALAADANTTVNGYPVSGEEYVSLAPGKDLTFGSASFQLKAGVPGLLERV